MPCGSLPEGSQNTVKPTLPERSGDVAWSLLMPGVTLRLTGWGVGGSSSPIGTESRPEPLCSAKARIEGRHGELTPIFRIVGATFKLKLGLYG